MQLLDIPQLDSEQTLLFALHRVHYAVYLEPFRFLCSYRGAQRFLRQGSGLKSGCGGEDLLYPPALERRDFCDMPGLDLVARHLIRELLQSSVEIGDGLARLICEVFLASEEISTHIRAGLRLSGLQPLDLETCFEAMSHRFFARVGSRSKDVGSTRDQYCRRGRKSDHNQTFGSQPEIRPYPEAWHIYRSIIRSSIAGKEPISVLSNEASAPRYAETLRNISESSAPDTVTILVAG